MLGMGLKAYMTSYLTSSSLVQPREWVNPKERIGITSGEDGEYDAHVSMSLDLTRPHAFATLEEHW